MVINYEARFNCIIIQYVADTGIVSFVHVY